MILYLLIGLLLGLLVAKGTESELHWWQKNFDWLATMRDRWANKYFEAYAQYEHVLDAYTQERLVHEEQLKDAVELERYLRDEERDEADHDIELISDAYQDIAKYYFELCEAVEAKGATLKDIRKRLNEGEL